MDNTKHASVRVPVPSLVLSSIVYPHQEGEGEILCQGITGPHISPDAPARHIATTVVNVNSVLRKLKAIIPAEDKAPSQGEVEVERADLAVEGALKQGLPVLRVIG